MPPYNLGLNCDSVSNWGDYFDFIWAQPEDSKILNLWIASK